ncbi:hypothetical protein M0638_23940 [Roseomonas sp. NAR14]|uniref:Uncharacterized protein n=1 Tax=Roseomonas acroporae TaxID=2937791 RepID=A0A9X1YJQ0_9PROT|nr:hypothetical protein [Roseomonas acroporae]MCK8787426.1 hypothetical protein [Roseomonas acroporae]
MSGSQGYQPPRHLLGDYTLRLDPVLMAKFDPAGVAPHTGWIAHTRIGAPLKLGLQLPALDDPLAPILAGIARDAAANPKADPTKFAQARLAAADTEVMDLLAKLVLAAGQGTWKDVTAPGTNMVTGEPASIGKIEPGGRVRHDGVEDSTVAGTGIDLEKLGAVSIAKKFAFASDLNVHAMIFVDKDAVLGGKMLSAMPGGGLVVKGRTSWGAELNLTVGAGRDQTGGAAGFIGLRIGPEIPPDPVRP